LWKHFIVAVGWDLQADRKRHLSPFPQVWWVQEPAKESQRSQRC